LHYIFPFLITLFFYRSHGKQYTLPILSERLISSWTPLQSKEDELEGDPFYELDKQYRKFSEEKKLLDLGFEPPENMLDQ
ncbi:hypothetical protein Ga0074115_15713, partial [endosymbiont of Ridgeia piscesae]